MFMKMNSMINNFSVVIPVFNEEEIFLESADKIFNICQEMNMPFEIIFSENGSLDNTKNLIHTFIEDKDNCFIINNNYDNFESHTISSKFSVNNFVTNLEWIYVVILGSDDDLCIREITVDTTEYHTPDLFGTNIPVCINN